MTRDFRYHASAPPGEWINDPNGLVFANGAYRLFVQHARDAPDFRKIGWARLSSPDLFDWRWDGPVIPPTDDTCAYSGSLVRGDGGGIEAYYTLHAPNGDPRQRQVRARGGADGDRWSEGEALGPASGPAGRNRRDPFVFWNAATRDWRMLVAAPCDWNDWAVEPPSRLEIWASPDRNAWAPAGAIGPWAPPGVMWEVPALIDFGETQALLISAIDRRSGGADCSVRYWLGAFDSAGFIPYTDWPAEGLPLDLGPDFYAAIPNVAEGWPNEDRVIIGWASSWATARAYCSPSGARGGPISQPRRLTLDRARRRLVQSPIAHPAASVFERIDASPDFALTLRRGEASLAVSTDQSANCIAVSRATAAAVWCAEHKGLLSAAKSRSFAICKDGPLIEILISPEGVTITAMLQGDGAIERSITP